MANPEKNPNGRFLCTILAVVCLLIALFFVYRSFYGMRIVETQREEPMKSPVPAVAGK